MKTRLCTALLALVAAALCAVASAPPAQGGGDNTVVAVNTKDGRFVYRVSLRVHRVGGETVDESNAAVAVSSCEDCRTVSVAIQALLVFGEPSTVTPENLALALNLGCSFCETLASAYQFVLSSDTRVHLTADGNRAIAELRRELQALRHEGLTIVELASRVDAVARRLLEILVAERR